MKMYKGGSKTFSVKHCGDCIFEANEYCNLGIGYVKNHSYHSILHENCPLRGKEIHVQLASIDRKGKLGSNAREVQRYIEDEVPL